MKKILATLCAVCMILSLAVPAFAANIQPRYEPCSVCGVGLFTARWVETSVDETSGHRGCTHNFRYGEDIKYRVTECKEWHCGNCGWSEMTTEYRYVDRWVCRGYN